MNNTYAKLNEVIRSAKTVQIMKDNGTVYHFKLYPFGERGTYIAPELMTEITESLTQSIEEHFPEFDYIASPEPGGHTWGMLAAYKLQRPINILRLSTELYEDFQLCVKRETAYNENYICFDGFKKNDRVLIVDDVVSSGATIRSIAVQMKEMGIELVGVQAILAKGEHYRQLEEDFGIPVRVLSKV
ncbi:phosphoribosyltransferase [Paenibacillus beijingensis]|uniref:Phosphoribosyltransferase domain-containing protein n=1 Tax=Paenibacillus beijingensis TaxID=1126833 RepID=A0A0D5NEM4_9BACL|nr:phosphoribosyltransferase [Paenibacillus beijingensis]AJY73427.1 hypothetical protein VN24_00760 [Paenibacillus beijingensis]